jgi:ABC-type dipeptide/oligopeptide/nickel transport system permease component
VPGLDTIARRAAATIFVLALIALIVFGIAQAIPGAVRPHLDKKPGTGVASVSR